MARARHRWSDEEIASLRAGVAKYGQGAWAKIRHCTDFDFLPHRTSVDLKDKWRNMEHCREPGAAIQMQPSAERQKLGARARHRWSDEEVACLRAGVARYGQGAWAKILHCADFDFLPHRTSVDLKDKWRIVGGKLPANVGTEMQQHSERKQKRSCPGDSANTPATGPPFIDGNERRKAMRMTAAALRNELAALGEDVETGNKSTLVERYLRTKATHEPETDDDEDDEPHDSEDGLRRLGSCDFVDGLNDAVVMEQVNELIEDVDGVHVDADMNLDSLAYGAYIEGVD